MTGRCAGPSRSASAPMISSSTPRAILDRARGFTIPSSKRGPCPWIHDPKLKERHNTFSYIQCHCCDGLLDWRKWCQNLFAHNYIPFSWMSAFLYALIQASISHDEGFRKVDPDRWEFANEGFLRGQKHLLKTISRRKPNEDILLDADKLPDINDSFWEQFITLSPMSGDPEEVDSSMQEAAAELQTGLDNGWDNGRNMVQLTEQMGLLISERRQRDYMNRSFGALEQI